MFWSLLNSLEASPSLEAAIWGVSHLREKAKSVQNMDLELSKTVPGMLQRRLERFLESDEKIFGMVKIAKKKKFQKFIIIRNYVKDD